MLVGAKHSESSVRTGLGVRSLKTYLFILYVSRRSRKPTVILAEYQDRILVFDLRASAYADEAEWYRGSLPFVSRNRRREVFLCSKIYHRQTEG